MLILAALLAVAPFDIKTHEAQAPPVARQSNAETKVLFVDRPNVSGRCPKAKEDWETVACTNLTWINSPVRIVMPNPCQYPDDNYARILCHELGHWNGWPGTHKE